MQKLRRFARYWDLVGNSGNFVETTSQIWSEPEARSKQPGKNGGLPQTVPAADSPFAAFSRWSEWLHNRVGRTDGIALVRLMEFLFKFLTKEIGRDPEAVAAALWRDYQRGGRMDKPTFLREFLQQETPQPEARRTRPGMLKRQARQF